MHEEFIGETKANIRTLFKQDEDMKQDMNKIKDSQNELKEITTILKIQQIQYSEQHELLTSMHENLVELNGTVRDLQSDVGNIDSRVGNLEESGKIDTREIKKEIIYKVLPSSIIGLGIGLLVAFLAFKLGWNINL